MMYEELGWVSLKERRNAHCLCLLYKMINGLAPSYLMAEIPVAVGTRTGRTLRNSDNVTEIRARTNLYGGSFLPSTLKKWNSLDQRAKSATSIAMFKKAIMPRLEPNPLFSIGSRKVNIVWSRIRLGCSYLKGQLHRMHIIDDPRCSCGCDYEDAYHFFFTCPLYIAQRTIFAQCMSSA